MTVNENGNANVGRTGADMTLAQICAVLNCVDELAERGIKAGWHWNDCGCCVSVHDREAEHVTHGFIVNKDGDAFWENVE